MVKNLALITMLFCQFRREVYTIGYDNQCMQYQRAQRQQTPFDRDIAALDEQAAVSQARIRALEQKYGGRIQDGEEAN